MASTHRDSRSRTGAASRRPSAGVVVVRRAGPLQRGTGRACRRSMSSTSGAEPPVTGPLRNGVKWSGPRPRSCSIRSAIWTCRYWRRLSFPGGFGRDG